MAKRAMDIIVTAALLATFVPVMAIAAVLIKLTSPGPVLFRWPVVGRDGRPFRAYKFRTMFQHADAMKQDLLDQNEAQGPIFKMQHDPRITPMGHVLRKFSLDELPQLWSILRGDMSLVGPRPVLDYEWEQFNEFQRQKLNTKPGGICLWHLRGQPRDLDEWVRLDLEYIHNWSLWLDLKILAGALWYVTTGRNC
jgi:lipopolysaccharide/colanic/teichoic acid biosynthesis glycosyltransferase